MERDFMGLAMTVKQETPKHDDEILDAAPLSSASAMQWSFSNKSSALPRVFSFHGANEEKPKTGFESLASTGLVTITTTEAFDSNQKSNLPVMQKNIVSENQGVLRYSTSTNVLKHLDTHAMRHAISNHNLKGFVSSPPLAGVPITNFVPNTPVVGTTDLRNGTNISGAPAQLTIFYNGSVCVYDNISSEKAQAIMLLAGNGPLITFSTTPPVAPVQTPGPVSSVFNGFISDQPYGSTPRGSSLMPINSITVSHSTGLSGNNINTEDVKPSGILLSSSPFNKIEPQRVVQPLRSIPSTFLSSDTVPQFRKKSLARFLEKRKERAINTSPYADKKSPDCIIVEAGSAVNSSGSCPVPAGVN